MNIKLKVGTKVRVKKENFPLHIGNMGEIIEIIGAEKSIYRIKIEVDKGFKESYNKGTYDGFFKNNTVWQYDNGMLYGLLDRKQVKKYLEVIE